MQNIELEILQFNYWEHFNAAKNLALILPVEHPRRKAIEKEMNVILKRIHELQQNKKDFAKS